ncbi:MAG: LPS assembly lipoprotein LptE [Planctomycetota bacterium]|jgi:hypothetical protein
MSKLSINKDFKAIGCGFSLAVFLCVLCFICGCGGANGYTDESMFPEKIASVYVEMFENETFWRGIEYDVTDAIGKRIEVDTPYKIISSRNQADSLISGQLVSIGQSLLSLERQTGLALEKEVELTANVSWKDLETGEYLIENESVSAAASYSELQSQSFKYASRLAANNLAIKIVELMEKQW